MKKFIFIFLFLCCTFFLYAQNSDGTSKRIADLKQELASAKDDTTKLPLLSQLFFQYLFSYPDSSLPYVQQEIILAEQIKSDIKLAYAYGDYAAFFKMIGDYPKALQLYHEALKLAEKSKDLLAIADIYSNIAALNADRGDFETAILYHMKAKSLMEEHWPPLKKFSPLPRQIGDDVIWKYAFIVEFLAQTYEKFALIP